MVYGLGTSWSAAKSQSDHGLSVLLDNMGTELASWFIAGFVSRFSAHVRKEKMFTVWRIFVDKKRFPSQCKWQVWKVWKSLGFQYKVAFLLPLCIHTVVSQKSISCVDSFVVGWKLLKVWWNFSRAAFVYVQMIKCHQWISGTRGVLMHASWGSKVPDQIGLSSAFCVFPPPDACIASPVTHSNGLIVTFGLCF